MNTVQSQLSVVTTLAALAASARATSRRYRWMRFEFATPTVGDVLPQAEKLVLEGVEVRVYEGTMVWRPVLTDGVVAWTARAYGERGVGQKAGAVVLDAAVRLTATKRHGREVQ
jgi:hypothetical protein